MIKPLALAALLLLAACGPPPEQVTRCVNYASVFRCDPVWVYSSHHSHMSIRCGTHTFCREYVTEHNPEYDRWIAEQAVENPRQAEARAAR